MNIIRIEQKPFDLSSVRDTLYAVTTHSDIEKKPVCDGPETKIVVIGCNKEKKKRLPTVKFFNLSHDRKLILDQVLI